MGVMKEIATRMMTDPNLTGKDPQSRAMRMIAQRPWAKQESASPPRITTPARPDYQLVLPTMVRQSQHARRPRRSATPTRPAQSKRERRRRKQRASVLSTFTLSFGSYRGWPLEEIPIDYLGWMLTAKNIPAADRWAAEMYLQAAAGLGHHQVATSG